MAVDVSSQSGAGATFVLYLPEAEDAVLETPDHQVGEPVIDGQGLCVLIVEDNVEVGEFSVQTLEEYGYRTRLVPTAEAALKALGRDGAGFDVVFSDVIMPGIGGIELARRLARQMPAMPVVLASGYSTALAAGGVGEFELLQKPYSIEELSRVLQRAVRQGLFSRSASHSVQTLSDFAF